MLHIFFDKKLVILHVPHRKGIKNICVKGGKEKYRKIRGRHLWKPAQPKFPSIVNEYCYNGELLKFFATLTNNVIIVSWTTIKELREKKFRGSIGDGGGCRFFKMATGVNSYTLSDIFKELIFIEIFKYTLADTTMLYIICCLVFVLVTYW